MQSTRREQSAPDIDPQLAALIASLDLDLNEAELAAAKVLWPRLKDGPALYKAKEACQLLSLSVRALDRLRADYGRPRSLPITAHHERNLIRLPVSEVLLLGCGRLGRLFAEQSGRPLRVTEVAR